jgi:hypothetical protein
MSTTATLTQTTLRLELLTLEVHGLIDRTMPLEILHEVAAYCVPRKLLRGIHLWGMRGHEAFMRLDINIDYEKHDQIVTLGGCDLPDGVAGEYRASGEPAAAASDRSAVSCPRIGKAVDLFMAALRSRGLYAAWLVSFSDGHGELYERFGIRGGEGPFTDHTAGLPANTIEHSVLPELSVSRREVPDQEDSTESTHQDERQLA